MQYFSQPTTQRPKRRSQKAPNNPNTNPSSTSTRPILVRKQSELETDSLEQTEPEWVTQYNKRCTILTKEEAGHQPAPTPETQPGVLKLNPPKFCPSKELRAQLTQKKDRWLAYKTLRKLPSAQPQTIQCAWKEWNDIVVVTKAAIAAEKALAREKYRATKKYAQSLARVVANEQHTSLVAAEAAECMDHPNEKSE
ncbi:hypothetical protein NEDG_01713 [Nematocida displodere]|uniref:Uncharacterized protein n=1 Tax=Nematocida displodere TaxID=1805483 RepID=A0A177EFE1_9MICR|nr:hypothetical protein NEDG_01713 [Nematocida displodere]